MFIKIKDNINYAELHLTNLRIILLSTKINKFDQLLKIF